MPSVDPMLASAGAVLGGGALGVVLTGMGRDGAEGARRLVEAGGSVMAQDEASSAVWGMPRAVAEAGLACAVLPPDKLARRVAVAGRGGLVQVSDSSSRILAGLLEARTGQQLTMSRRWRIETALAALLRERGIPTLDELITILVMGREPSLATQVVEALLNNETYFFRDRTPFDLLARAALPKLAQRAADSKRLRIWSAGCSTGQEAYSLAMLFAEDPAAMGRLDDRHPRHRRQRKRGPPRARRHLQPVRGAARPRHHPDDPLVRGMRRWLARGRAAAPDGPLPGPQPARAGAAPGPVRHRPVPQRAALPERRAARRWCSTGLPARWRPTAG